MGRRVAREFRAAGVSYVVLDFHDDAIAYAREEGELFIQGNGTEDEDLRKAGLKVTHPRTRILELLETGKATEGKDV